MSALEGKSVLVTGAARGIGAAIAEAVVEEGGAVALLDIDPAGAETAARLADRGPRTSSRATCGRSSEVERAVADAEQALGGLDGLVEQRRRQRVLRCRGDDARKTGTPCFAVDLKAAWMLAKAALRADRAPRRDRQHQLDPGAAHAARLLPYAAAKAGPRRPHPLARARLRAGRRARQRGRSGYTDTHLVQEWLGLQDDPAATLESVLANIPLGRMATPREIGNVVVFLLSDQASAITGATLAVDAGQAPFATDDLRARFSAVYTAALTDVLDGLGHRHQTLPPEIVPLEPGARVVGPAFTVEGRTNHSIDPEASIRRILEMLGAVPAGHVAVYEPGDATCAHFGELSATSLQVHGVAGVVINGGCRDVDLVRESGLPVFARYRTPQDAVSRWEVLEWGTRSRSRASPSRPATTSSVTPTASR